MRARACTPGAAETIRLPPIRAFFCKKRCTELMEANIALRHALIEQAEAHFNVILPGYTHLQHAQPVLFSHHMLAYVWMLTRDYERLPPLTARPMRTCWLAALAGTTYPLDRFKTTKTLGFDHPIPNSLDAVSDRDFLLDLIYACSVSSMHLSRLCEEIILWSTSEFGFITLSDAYSTAPPSCRRRKTPISPSLSAESRDASSGISSRCS